VVSPVAFGGLRAAAYRCRQGASLSELPEAAAPLMEPGRSSAATREPERSSAGARQAQRSAAPEVLAQRVPRPAEVSAQCAPLVVAAAAVAVSSDAPPEGAVEASDAPRAAEVEAAPDAPREGAAAEASDEAVARPQAAEAEAPGEQGAAAEASDEAAAQRQAAGVLDGAAGLRAAGPSASACRRDQALPWPALLPAGRFARARHLPRIAWP